MARNNSSPGAYLLILLTWAGAVINNAFSVFSITHNSMLMWTLLAILLLAGMVNNQ